LSSENFENTKDLMNKLILGTVQFGLDYGINNSNGKPNVDEIYKIFKFAKSNGIEILDTADAYGNASEIIGSYIKENCSVFQVNTKFKGGNKSLSKQLQESLSVLNIAKVGTYFFHSFDDFKSNNDFIKELTALKDSDLIHNIGLSVYDNHEFFEAINAKEIDVIQFPFNLFDNLHQRGQLMKLAKSKGKQLQVRSVFLQGLFFKNSDSLPSILRPLRPYLIAIKKIAQDFSVDIEHLALSYALQQPEIDHVIIGVDNLDQLQRNVMFALKPIAPEIMETLDQLFVKETELLYPKNWHI